MGIASILDMMSPYTAIIPNLNSRFTGKLNTKINSRLSKTNKYKDLQKKRRQNSRRSKK